MTEQAVEFHQFVGNHTLEGIEVQNRHSDAVVYFVVDGATYKATSVMQAGASRLRQVTRTDHMVPSTFRSFPVQGFIVERDEWGNAQDVLELRRFDNHDVVLELGTINTDSYYPAFIGNYYERNVDLL